MIEIIKGEGLSELKLVIVDLFDVIFVRLSDEEEEENKDNSESKISCTLE